jgi:hypothetical protein
MNAVALLIHDIQFPYQLFEEALDWAKEHEAEFRAVFLTNEMIQLESHDLQENGFFSTAPALIGGAKQIIAHHLRFLQQRATACHLPFRSMILTTPTLQQVIDHIRDADRIFVDVASDSFFEDWSFSRAELLRRIPADRHGMKKKMFA